MSDAQDKTDTSSNTESVIRNLGDPIRFTDVDTWCGFMAEASRAGQTAKVWTRLSLTSDAPLFHRIAESFASVVNHMAHKNGIYIPLNRADTVLMVIKADNTAELWVDTAAISLRCAVKRDVAAGTAVFEEDITDVTAMCFPCVKIESTDRVFCLFRQDWRFGLAFDFNPDGNLDVDRFANDLGRLFRELRYRHLYEALANQSLFGRIIEAGWFPFAEIITSEFKNIIRHCEAGHDIREIDNTIIKSFDAARMDRILKRWLAKPHFASREAVIRPAFDAYNHGEPVATIKIILTEIEGVLNDAYRAAHGGEGAKGDKLRTFAVESAKQKAGQPDTMLFPELFAEYLTSRTFANFDPVAQTGTARSRHAVGHGAAAPDTYTMTNALQAILTLDQLAFYT